MSGHHDAAAVTAGRCVISASTEGASIFLASLYTDANIVLWLCSPGGPDRAALTGTTLLCVPRLTCPMDAYNQTRVELMQMVLH